MLTVHWFKFYNWLTIRYQYLAVLY